MSKQSSLAIKFSETKQDNQSYLLLKTCLWVGVACACMLYGQYIRAAGGCGSVCLPLEALSPERTSMTKNQYRIAFSLEHADFDNFRAGDDDITNMGGNQAVITQGTLFFNYGFAEQWTASILLPYVRKRQQTNNFGTRIAEGVSDISVFTQYEYLQPSLSSKRSATVGLGVKFPTGSIDEPSDSNLLPPAFQAGSGAYDIIPTATYYKSVNTGAIFGDIFWRIPLEENKRGYKFGPELELNIGYEHHLFSKTDRFSLLVGASLLHAENDKDNNGILPGRLRDGTNVLNTGGDFIDFVFGFRSQFSKQFSLQLRLSVPVYEDWNGDSENNVGQVAPDLTSQLNLVYTSLN